MGGMGEMKTTYGRAPSRLDGDEDSFYSVKTAEAAFTKKSIDEEMDPKSRGKVSCLHQSPIIVCVDVTGSMGESPKIIFDKLPLFYGEILNQGYLEDPAISFCAIGDIYSDKAPLQVGEFGVGADSEEKNTIDHWIKKIFIEKGGGPHGEENYEMMAYYWLHYSKFMNTEKPFLFLCGDEMFYENISAQNIRDNIDPNFQGDSIDSIKMFKELRKKFHVFFLHRLGSEGPYYQEETKKQWSLALGAQNIIPLRDPKAIVDEMLGIIAIVSKSRTVDSYALDMRNRKQDDHRIDTVTKTLIPLAESLDKTIVTVDTSTLPVSSTASKRGKSERLD